MRFCFRGDIRLSGVKIKDELTFQDACNPFADDWLLFLDDVRVGTLRLTMDMSSTGTIDLLGARVGTLVDNHASGVLLRFGRG